MLLPLSHDSNDAGRPWVCLALIAALIAVFAHGSRPGADAPLEAASEKLGAAWSYWKERPYLEAPARLVHAFGVAPPRPDVALPGDAQLASEQAELELEVAAAKQLLEAHDWYRFGLIAGAPRPLAIVTHLFLHGGWFHLLANVWFLWLAGPLLERRLGRLHFTLLYFASGLAGAALFVTRHAGFDGPLIGASGAVAGVLGAFLVAAGRAKVNVLWGVVLPFGRVRVNAAALIALWFASQLLSALWSDAHEPGGVATWAHLGGFGFGMFTALALRGLGELQAVAPSEDASQSGAAATAEVGDAAALPALREAFAEDRPEVADIARFVASARAARCEDEIAPTLTVALWSAIEWRKRELALATWRALADAGVSPVGKPDALVQLAGWLRGAGHGGEASLALQLALRDAAPATALRIARAARKSDPVVALRAAESALASGQLADAERKELAALAEQTRRAAEANGLVVVPAEFVAPSAGATQTRQDAPSPRRQEARAEPPSAESYDRDALDLGALHADLSEGDAGSEGNAGGEVEKAEAPSQPGERALRITAAVPLALGDDAIALHPYGKGRMRLAYGRIASVSLAGVKGLAGTDKAVLILDLAAQSASTESLRVVRCRSDGFDPRALVAGESSPLQAMRALAREIAARSHAAQLPAGEAEAPLRIFPDLASYEREVWGAESGTQGRSGST